MTVSTGLAKARRSTTALALDPLPASKVQLRPLQIAEFDKHNSDARNIPANMYTLKPIVAVPRQLTFASQPAVISPMLCRKGGV